MGGGDYMVGLSTWSNSRRGKPIRKGSIGETIAEREFAHRGWTMFRTQPATEVVKVLTPAILADIKRRLPQYFGHLSWGHIAVCRILGGGIADYTGYDDDGNYLACEVKEAIGNTMPCSCLDKKQRAWMGNLPAGAAWVAIWWRDRGRMQIEPYKKEGSYKKTV